MWWCRRVYIWKIPAPGGLPDHARRSPQIRPDEFLEGPESFRTRCPSGFRALTPSTYTPVHPDEVSYRSRSWRPPSNSRWALFASRDEQEAAGYAEVSGDGLPRPSGDPAAHRESTDVHRDCPPAERTTAIAASTRSCRMAAIDEQEDIGIVFETASLFDTLSGS